MITKDQIKNLPNSIGIYIFKKENRPLYVGKSINIKARLSSHLEGAKLDTKERLIITNSNTIEPIITESEFKAIILEAKLIRELQPKYNSIWKDDKSPLYIKITIKEKYPKILLSRKPAFNDKSLYFGPFSSVRTAETIVNDIRRIIPFCTQKKLSRVGCFYSKINLCNPCPNEIENIKDIQTRINTQKQYRKNINQVASILRGKVEKITTNFYRQLKNLIKDKEYEKAIIIREKIFRFERLLNLHSRENDYFINKTEENLNEFLLLLKKYFPDLTKLQRIETYDISNFGLKQVAGSMVVMINGALNKKDYRRFRIKNNRLRSDLDRLKEVIIRRFNQDWSKPDLIIIDGGRPQVETIRKILINNKEIVPVIGIAKNPDRVIVGVNGYPKLILKNDHPVLNIIRLLRDESHRFARKYHLLLRSKDFLL